MRKIELWEKKLVWAVSGFLGLFIIVVGITTSFSGYFIKTFDEYIVLAVIVAIFPIAVVEYLSLEKVNRPASTRFFPYNSSNSSNRSNLTASNRRSVKT